MAIYAGNDVETANAAVVEAFVESMGKLESGERYARYFAPDGRVWWESLPDSQMLWVEDRFHSGPAAAAAAAKEYVAAGWETETEIHDIFACGPVVVTRRTDTVKIAGGPARRIRMSGLFTVRDGKIVEWKDFIG